MRAGWVLVGAWAAAVIAAPAPVDIRVFARAIQPGEVVQLTITTAARPVRVSAFGHDVPVTVLPDARIQALVGIDLDVRPGRYVVTVHAGNDADDAATRYPLVVRPKAFPTRRLQVAEAFVNPPAEVQARIAAEAERLAALFATTTAVRAWSGPFTRPVDDPANSAFGSRSILNGQPRSPHGGADFLSKTGTVIRAPNDGIIVLAADLYYTGTTIVIDHGQGLISLFAHLSRQDVTEGARVHAGDVVGLVGATGRVTGAHLHWTVRLNGARVDPLSLLAAAGEPPPSAPTAP